MQLIQNEAYNYIILMKDPKSNEEIYFLETINCVIRIFPGSFYYCRSGNLDNQVFAPVVKLQSSSLLSYAFIKFVATLNLLTRPHL